MSKRNAVLYYVIGLGCKQISALSIKYLKQTLSRHSLIHEDNIKIECPETKSALANITKLYINKHIGKLGLNPFSNSVFVYNLVNNIIADLNNRSIEHVIVFGHSYGGSVVINCAEVIQNPNKRPPVSNSNLNKLRMATFGSIYLPKPDAFMRKHVVNYLSNGDVAMKINGVKPIDVSLMTTKLKINRNPPNIICKILPKIYNDENDNLIRICLYDEKDNPLCLKKISITKWDEHRNYSLLLNSLLYNFAIGIEKFTNIYYSKKCSDPNIYSKEPCLVDNDPSFGGKSSYFYNNKSRKNKSRNNKSRKNKSRKNKSIKKY